MQVIMIDYVNYVIYEYYYCVRLLFESVKLLNVCLSRAVLRIWVDRCS